MEGAFVAGYALDNDPRMFIDYNAHLIIIPLIQITDARLETVITPAIKQANYDELYYPLGLVLRGEKSISSV